MNAQTVLDETHTRTVRSCAWSPSGQLLATASFDGTTGIWKNYGSEFDCISTLEVISSSILIHKFSPRISSLNFRVALIYHSSFFALLTLFLLDL